MSELTAIDILIDPDEQTLAHAREWNDRMRRSVADGFALDETHRPHITTLQRFVRTRQLEEVNNAVEGVLRAQDTDSLAYQGVGIRHGEWGVPGQGLGVILVRPSPEVLHFQADLLTAIEPFAEPAGTASAFVTDEGEEITESTLTWVEGFVPGQIGDGYTPHITIGFATLEDLATMEAEPFDAFDIRPQSLAIYHLGNNGTARRLLRTWPLAP